MSNLLKKLKAYFELSSVASIARRCFIKNGFDGAMTVLGIVIGAFISEITNPIWILSTGIGVSIAMGLSGFFGAYITEESERSITLTNIEKSMLRKLDKTVLGRAEKFAIILVALIDGLSPFIISMISLIPFVFSIFNIIPILHAIYFSLAITLSTLFFLGLYLGKVSKKNALMTGFKMLLAGLLLTIISFVFKIFI